MKQNSFRLFLGLFGEGMVFPHQGISETISTTDTVTYRVVSDISETCSVSEHFVVHYKLQDFVAVEEEFGARAKGATKTLFISDERYFKKKNA